MAFENPQHQARLKFLSKHSLDEANINGVGMILKHIDAEYKGEAFFDDNLIIKIYLSEISKASCKFTYIISKNNNLSVAKIIETVSESGELDNEPKFEGKNLTLMVLPKKLIKAVKKENVSTKNEVQ